MLAKREEIDFKDYVALILAFIQFLPLIVFIIVVVLIVLLLSFIRPVEGIFLLCAS